MNLKLIIQLSVFGLIMAFATVSLIPEKTEFIYWLVIFCFCAYVIAKAAPGKYFLHGFVLSLFNSLWITIAHLMLFTSYMAHHPGVAEMTYKMGVHPRLFTAILGVPSGIIFGIIQGLFAFIASKMVKQKAVA
jgi:hypothetical protein